MKGKERIKRHTTHHYGCDCRESLLRDIAKDLFEDVGAWERTYKTYFRSVKRWDYIVVKLSLLKRCRKLGVIK